MVKRMTINEYSRKKSINTPVLFLIFNRPENTKRVFKEIKKAKPKKLFIAADGPRENVPDDEEKCKKARQIVKNVDWPCEVKTFFRKKNVGGPKGIPEAIDWFFSNIEEGVILEDDCVPNQSFFYFCEELLHLYRDDTRVALISGNNFVRNDTNANQRQSYFFSRYALIWGWATWKKKWDKVDFSMSGWPEFVEENGLKNRFPDKVARNFWLERLNKMYVEYQKKGVCSSHQHWDRKLNMHIFMNSQLSVIPKFNLVTNIGYGNDSSNIKKKTPYHFFPTKKLNFPLNHPSNVINNLYLDQIHERMRFSGGFRKRLKIQMKRYLPTRLYLLGKMIKRFGNFRRRRSSLK